MNVCCLETYWDDRKVHIEPTLRDHSRFALHFYSILCKMCKSRHLYVNSKETRENQSLLIWGDFCAILTSLEVLFFFNIPGGYSLYSDDRDDRCNF